MLECVFLLLVFLLQNNSKSYGQTLIKLSGNVYNVTKKVVNNLIVFLNKKYWHKEQNIKC